MIYCVGETLYDIVFRKDKPEWAVPGGGMFNCAMSLGHAGADVQLLTELGNDRIGEMIRQTMHHGGVKGDYLHTSPNNTTLALAFLNDEGNADYQFYYTHTEIAPQFMVPPFKSEDILIFGSLYSVSQRNRGNIIKLSMAARNAGTTIIYDPNFRKSNLDKREAILPYVIENISLADIVRGSDEDFELIANAGNSEQASQFIFNAGGRNLIITRNKDGVDLLTDNQSQHFDAIPVEVVSTIGAGDAFNAGIAYRIHQYGKIPSSSDEWKAAISNGLSFAAEVCSVRENYIKARNI